MDVLHQIEPMTAIVLISSMLIIVLVLFAKFIKGILKLAVIAVMILCMLYALRDAGII